MAATFRAAGSAATGTSSVTISAPAGIQNDDLLLAAITDRATSGTSTPPTGWTALGSATDSSGRLQVHWAIVGKNGLTGTSWTWSTTTRSIGHISAFYNVDTTTPVDVWSAQANGNGTNAGSTSVTPNADGEMIVGFFGDSQSGSAFSAEACATNPSSLTEAYDATSGNFCGQAGAYALQTGSAGATGASSSTANKTSNHYGMLLALKNLVITGYPGTILADSPIAYYRLGESSGTTATDSSGNSHNGTYSGTYTQGQTGAISGDSDTALLLGGTNGQIDSGTGTFFDLGDGPLSIEAWIKRTGTGTTDVIMHKGTNTYHLRIGSDNKLQFHKANVSNIVSSTNTITDTNWHHVVATKNGSAVKLYIDGSDVTGTVNNQTLADATGSSLRIGTDSNVWSNEYLDEVALYGSVLSATQVLDHYNAGAGSGTYSGAMSASAAAALAGASVLSAVGSVSPSSAAALAPTSLLDTSGSFSASVLSTLDAVGGKLLADSISESVASALVAVVQKSLVAALSGSSSPALSPSSILAGTASAQGSSTKGDSVSSQADQVAALSGSSSPALSAFGALDLLLSIAVTSAKVDSRTAGLALDDSMSGSSSPALASVALLDVSQAATASSSKGNAVLAQSIMDEAVSASAGPALSSAGLLVMVAQAAQSLSLLLATAGGSLYLESVGMSGLSSLTASAINAVSTSIAEALLSGLSLSSQADIVAQNVASSSPALGAAGKLQMNAAVSTPSVSDLAAGAKTITTVSITGSVAALLAMSSTVTAGGTTYAGSIASSSTSSAAAAAVLEAIGQAANSTLVGLDPSSQADLSILVTFQTGGRLDASGVVDTLAAVSDALQADLAVATISAHGAVIAGEVTRFDLLSPGTASSWRSLDASPMTEFARLDAGPVRSYR